MQNINFCKHTRDKFVQELKRVRREIIAERAKKEKDELARFKERLTIAEQLRRIVG